jgi:multimeric flavodoxin WrbA
VRPHDCDGVFFTDVCGEGGMAEVPEVRKGQTDVALDFDEFAARFRARFFDPTFEREADAIDALTRTAWDAYHEYRKSPRTRAAGPGFADPDHELPVEWLRARQLIQEAEARMRAATRVRVLLVCASPRTDQTCSGEMSKTFRLTRLAEEALAAGGAEVDLLDLSRLTAEYGRVIYPCKSCVSTAMPLCHWPCSCYPNHAIGQVGDWMHEIYPRWVEAHGVMIVTPVHWYQAPSTLKLMMDRLVCADGGNTDPTSTHGKNPKEAKVLELAGWPYPRHLAGRVFALVVHGDTEGVGNVTHALHGWLSDMRLIPAQGGVLGRYVGYYRPYATSHLDLDDDAALHAETRNAAAALLKTVAAVRSGAHPGLAEEPDPRPK